MGQPHELGWAATFLASPFASFITGHTMVVDGANWQRRAMLMPEFVPIREQMGTGPLRCSSPPREKEEPPSSRSRPPMSRTSPTISAGERRRADIADDRPRPTPAKLNAWSWESARQITARADAIRFDDRIRVVIVRAEGRAFCAGVDLGMPEDRITGRSPAEKVRNYYEKFRWVHERFRVLSNLPQPVIMAIHGYCLGAGLEVAMMGDIRIAADDAQFALPEPKVGVSIDAGGDLRMLRRDRGGLDEAARVHGAPHRCRARPFASGWSRRSSRATS